MTKEERQKLIEKLASEQPCDVLMQAARASMQASGLGKYAHTENPPNEAVAAVALREDADPREWLLHTFFAMKAGEIAYRFFERAKDSYLVREKFDDEDASDEDLIDSEMWESDYIDYDAVLDDLMYETWEDVRRLS